MNVKLLFFLSSAVHPNDHVFIKDKEVLDHPQQWVPYTKTHLPAYLEESRGSVPIKSAFCLIIYIILCITGFTCCPFVHKLTVYCLITVLFIRCFSQKVNLSRYRLDTVHI